MFHTGVYHIGISSQYIVSGISSRYTVSDAIAFCPALGQPVGPTPVEKEELEVDDGGLVDVGEPEDTHNI